MWPFILRFDTAIIPALNFKQVVLRAYWEGFRRPAPDDPPFRPGVEGSDHIDSKWVHQNGPARLSAAVRAARDGNEGEEASLTFNDKSSYCVRWWENRERCLPYDVFPYASPQITSSTSTPYLPTFQTPAPTLQTIHDLLPPSVHEWVKVITHCNHRENDGPLKTEHTTRAAATIMNIV